ncbi:MAG: efflux RND transporter periplasmic adaptor subunit, partial [Limisphaerales bacterium]
RNAALFRQKIVSQEISQESEAAAAAQQAVVAADQAAVTNAELQLSFCYIHSPISGRAGTLLVTPGNVVKNLDTVLVTIEQVQPIYVDFSMPERDLQSIQSRLAAAGSLPVEVSAPHEPGPPSRGDLAIINNAVDTNTGTILLRGEFPNQDARLWPGQFVETALTLTMLTNAVVVPSPAVQTGQQSNYVFVVQSNSTVETRPVELGESVGNEQVISQGVRAGERVVVTGQIRLAPGTKVRIERSPP